MIERLGLFEIPDVQVHMARHSPPREAVPRPTLACARQVVQIERLGGHHQLLAVHTPLAPRTVRVDLDAETVGIPQVHRLAHQVIGGRGTHVCVSQVGHEPAQGRPVGHEDREVIQTEAPVRRQGACSGTLIQLNQHGVVVVRSEHGDGTLAAEKPQTNDLAVEPKRPFEVRHQEPYSPDARRLRQTISGRLNAVLTRHRSDYDIGGEYNRGVDYRPQSDPLSELPTGEPASRGERWRAAIYIVSTATLVSLVLLAVVFDEFAATGVLLIVFLSFVVTYLIAPAVERLRHAAGVTRRGRPLSRSVAVLAIYGAVTAAVLPFWVFGSPRVSVALERMRSLVPHHTARFIDHLRASEVWADSLGLPPVIQRSVGDATRSVSRSIAQEARALGAELTGIRRLVPWLSTVPVVAFLLLTRWTRFRRSTTRVLPTPHLQWRGNEFLRNLNGLLAAYTRAQAMSGVIIGVLSWIGFAALGLPYPGTLGLAAGLLETIPLAGPLVMAVVATATAPDRVVQVLAFLAGLRVLQDYVIYPRLISKAMHLHPLAVVIALWAGAALGGIVGVCLAIPVVGTLQVTVRHWREYRDIEALVEETIRRDTA